MHHHHNQARDSHKGQIDGNKPHMRHEAQMRRVGDDGFNDLCMFFSALTLMFKLVVFKLVVL